MVRLFQAVMPLFLLALLGACVTATPNNDDFNQIALDRVNDCIRAKCPVIFLNSPGGEDIRYGERAEEAVRMSGIPVHVDTDCSSVCTLPLFAASRATVAPGATVRIHPVTYLEDEQIRTMRGPGATVRKRKVDWDVTRAWAQKYLAHGMPRETVARLLKGEAVTLQPSDFEAMGIRIVDRPVATR